MFLQVASSIASSGLSLVCKGSVVFGYARYVNETVTRSHGDVAAVDAYTYDPPLVRLRMNLWVITEAIPVPQFCSYLRERLIEIMQVAASLEVASARYGR